MIVCFFASLARRPPNRGGSHQPRAGANPEIQAVPKCSAILTPQFESQLAIFSKTITFRRNSSSQRARPAPFLDTNQDRTLSRRPVQLPNATRAPLDSRTTPHRLWQCKFKTTAGGHARALPVTDEKAVCTGRLPDRLY